MYLLDTNVCVRYLNGSAPAVRSRLRRTDPAEIRLCSVVKAELLFGALHSDRRSANLEHLRRFWAPYQSVAFDDACAERCAEIREALTKPGRPIGSNDLLIAAIALTHGLTLVTHNIREFSRVRDLRFEDWESPTEA